MSKLLVCLGLLVLGCAKERVPAPIDYASIVEDDYPVLKCVKAATWGAVLCKDLENHPYICFTTAGYPRNTTCLVGYKPSIPYKYVNTGNFNVLTVSGATNLNP